MDIKKIKDLVKLARTQSFVEVTNRNIMKAIVDRLKIGVPLRKIKTFKFGRIGLEYLLELYFDGNIVIGPDDLETIVKSQKPNTGISLKDGSVGFKIYKEDYDAVQEILKESHPGNIGDKEEIKEEKTI